MQPQVRCKIYYCYFEDFELNFDRFLMCVLLVDRHLLKIRIEFNGFTQDSFERHGHEVQVELNSSQWWCLANDPLIISWKKRQITR